MTVSGEYLNRKRVNKMKQVCDVKKLLSDKNYIREIMSETPLKDKNKILNHLRKGTITAAAAGRARDVISGEIIDGELTYLTDGVYEWRSDIPYYVDKYNVRLNDDFIHYVMSA